MGRILTVASSKGGGGKTLFCCVLAPGLAAHGYKVGVIDADPNAGFLAWHNTYTGPEIRCQAEARDIQVVDLAHAWSNDLDVVIIDTAGFGNLTAAAAMSCADHVFVPAMPDRGSTREAARTVEKVASLARAARRAIPASIILSQWRQGGQAEAAALADLADFSITSILQTPVPDRVAFRKLSFDGRVVGGALSPTIDSLVTEIAELAELAKRTKVKSNSKKVKAA